MIEEDVIGDFGSDVQAEEIEEEPRNIILGIISQLSIGMDLSKISFPTFVLEPRSLLERITDFMSHQDIILSTSLKDDPLVRFLDVVRYFLSGWHIQPKGVKKPYNPVVGEYFRCHWNCVDGSKSYYIAEQIEHHPPTSAYFMANPKNNLVIAGNFRPRTKFLGNSIQSKLEGQSNLYFLNRPEEEYTLSNPSIYARGILFGTMFLELGDSVKIECLKTGYHADIDFLVKGYFTGTYNAIEGKVFESGTGNLLYNISGKWSEIVSISSSAPDAMPVLFFNAKHPICPMAVAPISEQNRMESRRLWQPISEAIVAKDFCKASEEKHKIEEDQRHLAKVRLENDLDWQPNFFRQQNDGLWVLIEKNLYSKSKTLLRHIDELLKRHDFIKDRAA